MDAREMGVEEAVRAAWPDAEGAEACPVAEMTLGEAMALVGEGDDDGD